jgi:hypothetical protein
MSRKTFNLVDKILDALYKADSSVLRLPSDYSGREDVAEVIGDLDALISKVEELHYELGMELELDRG